jgi:hypothetical protein
MPSQHSLLRLLREAITRDESFDLDVSEADSVVPDWRVEAAVPPSAAATHEPAQARPRAEDELPVAVIELGVLEQDGPTESRSAGQPSIGSASTEVPARRAPDALVLSEEISDPPAQYPGPDVAARPASASVRTEIAPLRGSQDRREVPSTRPSGTRSPSAPRGRVTTKTSSPGFVRFQIRTARAPRPRFGQNPRKLPLTWLVVRIVKSERIGGGQPRQRLVQYREQPGQRRGRPAAAHLPGGLDAV